MAGGQPTPYQRKVPALWAYAALKVAEQHLATKNPLSKEVIQATLPVDCYPLVDAGCEIIKNFYGYRHIDKLGAIDCPEMAHFVISRGLITPKDALENAEKNGLKYTAQELRARDAALTNNTPDHHYLFEPIAGNASHGIEGWRS